MKFKKYIQLEVGDVIFVAGTGVVYKKDGTSEDYEKLFTIIDDYINNSIQNYELKLIDIPKKD